MKKQILGVLAFFLCLCMACSRGDEQSVLWQIGDVNYATNELALGPQGYKKFIEHDFGFEDRSFILNYNKAKQDFPYTLPGPMDTWGGTWNTAGWRTHEVNLFFTLENEIDPQTKNWELVIHLADVSVKHPPLLKVVFNDYVKKQVLKAGISDSSLVGRIPKEAGQVIRIPIPVKSVYQGSNHITLTTLEGSWLLFDAITLYGPQNASLAEPQKAYIHAVSPAEYEVNGKQPLLVDVEQLEGNPTLSVWLDNQEIFSTKLDTARFVFEAPMSSVKKVRESNYEVRVDGNVVSQGRVIRTPQRLQTVADYVDTRIGTAHSRWMIAPGPWMPFGLVKLSPDNQNAGWQAGYQPTFESVGCFSHIHEWTMAGLGMLPTNGPLQTFVGVESDADSGYRSRIDKQTEESPIGYYKVHLTDYDIWAELTATTHCGMQRYTYPEKLKEKRVMVDLHIPAEYDYQLKEVDVYQDGNYRLIGVSHQLSPRVWSSDADQEYKLHFVIEFDHPIQRMGFWRNDEKSKGKHLKGKDLKEAGVWVEFDKKVDTVQARSGISLVSVKNAKLNLLTEITQPFGWSFDRVYQHQKEKWNELLGRVDITTNDRQEKVKFYTNMYRALCSRNQFSDVNGDWVSADEKVRHFSRKGDVALGCDAFWNTFWNLNSFWNLVTPEWSNKWVRSQLAMYDANGWLAKGPAGMEYIPVMVAEHEIPLLVSTWQMGIRDYDVQKMYQAIKKMQTTPSRAVCGGYAGNRDLRPYLKHHYVPYDKGRFSNSLEYSFDDWSVGQLAKALHKTADYYTFNKRGYWWRNAIHPSSGFAHMKDSKGHWMPDFDAFRSGANEHYVEGNAWQLTFFVPQDVPALIDVIGQEAFVKRLGWGFSTSYPWRFNAPNDQYWDYPVMQGNQQSMHFAYLFNWAKHPWLTQHWVRSIMSRYYGSGIANAYLGDEDQGQMSAWYVMAAIGLFQTDGGCAVNPTYEIGSPLYPKTVIHLDEKYGRGETFTIEAKGVSRTNKYIQSAYLNGQPLNSFRFSAQEVLKGGSLILKMGSQPNKNWGIE